MKSIFSCISILAFSAVLGLTLAAWADDMSGMAMSTPAVSQSTVQATPAAKKKAKKKSATKVVWVCPMGDYSGPKTSDGKCPKCGMDLVKKVVPADAAASSTPDASSGH